MPTYEYLCSACKNRFETWQKMADEPLTTCPECGGSIRRVLHATGIVFKGSGFYKTDYGKNGKASANGSNEGSGDAAKTESTSSKETSGNNGSNGASESKTSSTPAASESKAPASNGSSSGTGSK